YERFVAGMEQVTLGADERPLGAWFGRFSPPTVRMIPLIEDREHLLAADDLVRDYLRGKELEHMRVFIARSDPALNYGYLSAVLLALVALERLAALEGETGVAIHPVIGVGSVPFRGGLTPRNVGRVLTTYPSVQTFTIQSAFKYDHPPDAVRDGIAQLRAHERIAPACPLSSSVSPQRPTPIGRGCVRRCRRSKPISPTRLVTSTATRSRVCRRACARVRNALSP